MNIFVEHRNTLWQIHHVGGNYADDKFENIMSTKFNDVTMEPNARPSIDDLNDIIRHYTASDDQFDALVKASTEFDESTVEAFAAACAAWVKADFNARFPGASGPEPVRCEFCGGDLPRLRAHVCHCSEDCWREWQREQDNR